LEANDEFGAVLSAALEQRGHTVVVVSSGSEANRHPRQFDCGIFSGPVNQAVAIALAGWFLAENRVRCVVFIADHLEPELRVRAANLGALVLRHEGVQRLCDAVEEEYRSALAQAQAAGAEDEPLIQVRRELKSGPYRKLP
jgi:hypothetical protein